MKNNAGKLAEKGFTLVELLSVIAIIAIVAAIAIPAYSSYVLKAQIGRAIVEIRMLEKEIFIYGSESVNTADVQKDFPPRESAGNSGNSGNPSNSGNSSEVADLRLPDSLAVIGYGNLKDPWGRPYEYLKIAGSDQNGKGKQRRDRFMNPLNTDYDLYSIGPDGETTTNLNAKNSRDDIVRANNGAYVGEASKF